MKINKNNNYFNLEKKNTKIKRIDLYKIIKINDPQEKIIYNLILSVLKERTKSLNSKDFLLKKAELYDTYINMSSIDLQEFYLINFSLEFIASKVNYNHVKNLFQDFLNNNLIIKDILEIEKENYLIKINNQKNSLQDIAYNILLNKILPDYYLTYDKIINVIENINIETINKYVEKIVNENFILEINYNLENVKFMLEEKKIKSNFIYNNHEEVIEKTIKNEQLNYYFVFEINKNYNYYERQLFNEYFGANVNSKLFSIIREEKHLCYSVYSTFITKNLLIIYVGLDPLKANECKEEIMKIINKINQENIRIDIFKKQLINKYDQNQDKYFFYKKIIEKSIIDNELVYDIEKINDNINQIDQEKLKDIAANLKLIKEIKIS